MHLMKNKGAQILVALGLGILGLYLALRGVNFSDIQTALQNARWSWVILAIPCMLVSFLLRAYRWRILLNSQLSVSDAFGLINIGYLVSDILPLRLGDPARAVAASMRSDIPIVTTLSTVVIERTLDLLTAVLFLVLTLPFIAVGNSAIAGLVSGGAALILLITLILMAGHPEKTESIARAVLTRLPLGDPERWLAPLRDILKGLQALNAPRTGIALGLLSLGIWGAVIVYYIVLQHALLYEAIPQPAFLAALVVTWATALGMAVPSQGGIGGYHAAAKWALTLPLFGTAGPLATTYALLAHAISYILGVALGASALMLWGISLKEITTTSNT